jgi:hypothetical protein
VPASRTVEGTLIRGMPAAFAGCRGNASLGRSVSRAQGSLPLGAGAPATAGVLWTSEEGNVVGVRQAHALDTVDAKKRALRCSRTRPSLGPETRARQSSLNSKARKSRGGGAENEVSRSGKPAQAGGTGTGASSSGRTARLAARHRSSPEEVVRDALKEEDGRGRRPPVRNTRVRVGLPVRRSEVAEVDRRRLASNTLVRSAPKRVAVLVNGGLARGGDRRESAGGHVGRKGAR